MYKLFLIFFLIFRSAGLLAANSAEPFSITVGSPQIEYSASSFPYTFASLDIKDRQTAGAALPEYHNLQTYHSDHKFFRVNLTLTITPRSGGVPEIISILYSFSYNSEIYELTEEGKIHNKKKIDFPLKLEEIPIKKTGITKWTITSPWMVKSPREYWDPYKGGFVRSDSGRYELVREAKKFHAFFEPISKFYFPFDISYWSEKYSEKKWPEILFPSFTVRKVEGNETYSGCKFQVFTGGLSDPATGNIGLPTLHSFVNQVTNDWENPYENKNVYSNNWEKKEWAAKYRKIVAQDLKTAFLARICLADPNDSDAADLLLQNLAEKKDNEKARQVYLRCKLTWPKFSEYWFNIYYKSLQNEVTKRAAVMAFRRDHPDSGFALGTLVRMLIDSGRLSAANSLHNIWKEKEPSNIFVYAAEAQLAKSQNNTQKEKQALSKIIQLSGDKSKINISSKAASRCYQLYLAALNLIKSKKYNTALINLRTAINANTNFVPAYVAMGETYADLKVFGLAKKQFEAAFALDPENPAVLAGLIRYSTPKAKYQKKLWTVLKPEINIQKNKGNWTNALNIAQFAYPLLEGSNPLLIDLVVSYAESLIELKLYENASVILYDISQKNPDNPKLNYLWGEFSEKIHNDPNFLLLENRPFDWKENAVKAYNKVIKDAPKTKEAYSRLAILYVQHGELSKAFKFLEKLYRIAPSGELALWIADICFLKSLKNSKEIVPGSSSKTYLETARDFYKKASLKGPSPAANLGLIRTEKLLKKDPAPSIRQSLKSFPGSPELRAEKIRLHVETETAAPILWAPYTNMLEELQPYHYDSLLTFNSLFKQRNLKTNEYDSLIKLAFSILKMDAIYFSDITSQLEYQQPPEVYTLEKRLGFYFKLKKQLFLKPVQAYPWYAIRSKYKKNDLRTGKTKWWKRRKLIMSAYKYLKAAAEINQKAKHYINLLEQEFDRSFMLSASSCPSAYNSVLATCFYTEPTKRERRRYSTFSLFSDKDSREKDMPSSYQELVNSIHTPAIIRDRWALPPSFRELYLPPFALQKIFKLDYKNKFSPVWDYYSFINSRVDFIDCPINSTNFYQWKKNISQHSIMNLKVSEAGFSVSQTESGGHITSSWFGVGGALLTQDRTFPNFSSFLENTFSGAVQNLTLSGAKIDKKHPPEFSLVFSTAPMDCPVEEWYDEALVLQLSWPNHTNPVLRVFAKVFNEEEGMAPGLPGIKLGEISSPAFTNIYFELSKDRIKAGVNFGGGKSGYLNLKHKLSPFAWSHGFYLNVQFKACENPVSYSLDSVGVHSKIE